MAKARSNNSCTIQGERYAVRGYKPQYEEFAKRVYDSIVNGTLVEIRVADFDENVGKLDDICYVTNDGVYAYQVKWSNTNRVVTLSEFKSLLSEILDGWKKIQKLYPGKTVFPHLLTNRKCGARFDIKKPDTIAQLKTISKLNDEEWDKFWGAFSFIPEYIQEDFDVSRRKVNRRIADVRDLVSFIVGKVADKEGYVVIKKQEIINSLNWNDLFESLYDHNLVVPETTYEPNGKAMDLLNALLKSKTKGYIFLKGTPGSGKSTLLTQWVRSIPNRAWRYYAFDFTNPTSQRFNDSPRGEAVSFLYDIMREIEGDGYGSFNTLRYKDYQFLKNRFHELLKSLSKEYRKTKLPFVIVVDGLDHITREYNVKQISLMEALPSNADIPDGVVFVLGSQHFDNLGLNKDIENESNDDKSLIVMPPFTQEEVGGLVAKILGTKAATGDLIVKCMVKSQGHPLYLQYILNQIKSNGIGVVDSIAEYANDVEAYYDRIIGSSLGNAKMKCFLGLLSRVVGSVDFDIIRKWNVDEQVVMDFKKEMWHLFKHSDDGNAFSFFHNSFRQYLLNKTAIDILSDKYSHQINLNYYKVLCHCFEEKWDEGYYLYKAEEYGTFINKLTPEELFKQAQTFRPIWSIRNDVRYAIDIAKQQKNPYLLVRYLLFEAQLSQMGNVNYSCLSLVEDFVKAGKIALTTSIVRDDKRLYCSLSYARELAKILMASGNHVEATKLFDLSYPVYILKPEPKQGVNRAEYREELDELKSWVNAATYFMPLDKIGEKVDLFVEYLRKIAKIDRECFNGKRVRNEFGLEYAKSIIEQKRWSELDKWLKSLDEQKELVPIRFFALRDASLKCYDIGDAEKSQKYRNKLVEVFNQIPKNEKPYLQMAFLGMKLGVERQNVKDWLDQVAWTDIGSYYVDSFNGSFNELRAHIAYVRLRAIFGYDDKITELVPDNTSDKDNALLEQYIRKVFYLAKLDGMAMSGHCLSTELTGLFDNFLSFFDKISNTSHNHYAFTIRSQRADFYEFMVDVASHFGKDALDNLVEKMEKYFTKAGCKANSLSKRKAIVALYKKGIDKQDCQRMLEEIESTMMSAEDLDGRVEEVFSQGQAWMALGETDRAMSMFSKVILESFGIGYRKDYQATQFVEWISHINKIDPEKAVNRFLWMTSRLRYIQEVTEGNAAVYAGETLLRRTLEYDFGSGIKLAKWLLNEELGYFQSASKTLLESLLEKVSTIDEYATLLSYYTGIHLFFCDDSYETDTHLLEDIVNKGKCILGDGIKDVRLILQKSIETQCPEKEVDVLLEALNNVFDKQVEEEQVNIEIDLPDNFDKNKWTEALEAVEQSHSSGWARFYDGGSRIDACKILQEIDKEKGREITFDLLADDIGKGYDYGTMQYLEEIVPLLTDEVDPEKLFSEEYAYMNRILRGNTICENDMPDITPTGSTVVDAMEDWLLYLAEMPVICLSERVMMMLARLVDEGKVEISEKLKTLSNAERKLLEMGMYLKELGSSQLILLKQQSLESAVSDNYLNRIYANKILNALKIDAPKPTRKSLSPTYQMSFAKGPKYDWGSAAVEKEGVRDWNDADSIMAVASHITGYLAYLSGLNQTAINVRAVTLMRKYGPVTDDNTKADEMISNHYKAISLRYPYRRAHALAALDGAYEVAAELLDSGAIDETYNDDNFLSYDFSVINLSPCAKPNFIHRIAEKEKWSVSDGWDTSLKDFSRFNDEINRFDGMNVIGEYTYQLKRDYKVPVEEYMSKLSYENKKTDADNFFGETAYQRQTSEYLNLGNRDAQIIIVRGGYFSISGIKLRWIAFNPATANALGWEPSDKGLFAWNDTEGNKMVKTLYWQNGNIFGRDNSNYEVGEGWLVLASDKALEAIKAVSKTYLHKLVQRGFQPNRYAYPHSMQKIYCM